MNSTSLDRVFTLRSKLASLEPAPNSTATIPPSVPQIYAPDGHEAALDPERPIVVGGRGTGKSFWSATLLAPQTRLFVAASYPRLHLEQCDVALGFAGVDSDKHRAPSSEELDDLINVDGHPPEKVWRAVVLRAARHLLDEGIPQELRGPEGLVAWVSADASRTQGALRRADELLRSSGRRVVVLFDALDRLGANWPQIRERTRALLQVALAMRTYRAIKLKIFLRVDQAEDREIAAFPDASKLLGPGSRVDLTWESRDLYGLLFTLLANDVAAEKPFAALVDRATGISLGEVTKHGLPEELKDREALQAKVFDELAGEYMGSSKTKGRTYTWLPKHLADAHGRVSPRIFLEAIRQAASHRGSQSTVWPLTPVALRAGIQGASEIRLQQLKEEYYWIEDVIRPLAEQQVPCEEQDLFDRWTDAGTLAAISRPKGGLLEPIELSEAEHAQPATILKSLLRIGAAERRADGRINIPDIYRVAAKMLRKGGVKPKR